MRQLLLLLFAGIPVMAYAQTGAVPARGINSNSDAPVNVSAPALRPSQPAQHASVPVQNPGQFYVKDDKPVTATGDPIAAPNAGNSRSKEELIKQLQEMMKAEKARNMLPAEQKPSLESESKPDATQHSGNVNSNR